MDRTPADLLAELRLLGANPRLFYLANGEISIRWGDLHRTAAVTVTADDARALKVWLALTEPPAPFVATTASTGGAPLLDIEISRARAAFERRGDGKRSA